MTSSQTQQDTAANGRSPSYGRDPRGKGPSESTCDLELKKPEKDLLEYAKQGELLEFPPGKESTDGQTQSVFDSMPAWGTDRTIRAEVLRHLLIASQWPVHIKGVHVRGYKITGRLDLESAMLRCPVVLKECYLEDKVVLNSATASLLKMQGCLISGLKARLLVVTETLDLSGSRLTSVAQLDGARATGDVRFSGAEITTKNEDGAGLLAEAIKVGGDLYLDSHFRTVGEVRLKGARIKGDLWCDGAAVSAGKTDGAALAADEIKVGGAVSLNGEFRGAVQLRGARITGDLTCSRTRITGFDSERNALIADEVTVGGGLLLNDGFCASGAVRLHGADITGDLNSGGAKIARNLDGNSLVADMVTVGGDLLLDGSKEKADVLRATGAVRLLGANISGQLRCGARIKRPDKYGDALIADRVTVGGRVLLKNFEAAGAVRLPGASIAGDLDCGGAKIEANKWGNALTADRVKIGGDLFLNNRFRAAGAVRLRGASIPGKLDCKGARIKPTGRTGHERDALIADGATVSGRVLLCGQFKAFGAVRLRDASIGGDLRCSGARIKGSKSDSDPQGNTEFGAENALIADRVRVSGNVLLDDEFTAFGAVRLRDATIGGDLRCSGAQITGTNTGADSRNTTDIGARNALIADRVKVNGSVLLDREFKAIGTVRLSGARLDGLLTLDGATLEDRVALMADGATIGQQLIWAPKTPVTGVVSLERTHLHSLNDDWSQHRDNAYWPHEGNLRLAGFEYDEFGGTNTRASLQDRLKWIRGQQRVRTRTQPGTFEAQPYERLVRVYREAGQDSEAREIAIARRTDLRKYGDLGWWRRRGNWMLGFTVGHGYKPLRAVGILAVVYVLAFGLFFTAQHKNLMVPAKETPGTPKPTAMKCVESYPCFYPAGYAFDVTIPIISSGQSDNWRPDTAADWGWVFVAGTWFFTGTGWALAALVGVGYTGLIRKD
jgi:hypothetical protein